MLNTIFYLLKLCATAKWGGALQTGKSGKPTSSLNTDINFFITALLAAIHTWQNAKTLPQE